MRALFLLPLAACAGPRAAPELANEVDSPRGYTGRPVVIPGERASYLVHVLEVPVGTIDVDVSPVERRAGVDVAWASTVIKSEGGIVDMVTTIHDQASTCFDVSTALPVATRGSFVNLLSGRVDPFEDDEVAWAWTDPIDHNGHTLLFSLRGWDAEPGERATIELHSRNNTHTTELRFVGREELQTELGPWPTVRVDGRILRASSDHEDFLFSLWMADDTTRAPLRLDSDTDIGLRASARIQQYLVP